MNVLECSLLGDQRFTAECAMVEVYGEVKSIFEHFQEKKRFLGQDGGVIQLDSSQTGGIRPLMFRIGEAQLPVRYGTMYYILLWVKFLESNMELVDYLSTFDNYIDSTKKGNYIVGADVIRMYFQGENGIKYLPEERGKALKKYCQPLSLVLKNQIPLTLMPKDLDEGFDYLIYTGKIFS